jgi:hypothetical protein
MALRIPPATIPTAGIIQLALAAAPATNETAGSTLRISPSTGLGIIVTVTSAIIGSETTQSPPGGQKLSLVVAMVVVVSAIYKERYEAVLLDPRFPTTKSEFVCLDRNLQNVIKDLGKPEKYEK